MKALSAGSKVTVKKLLPGFQEVDTAQESVGEDFGRQIKFQ